MNAKQIRKKRDKEKQVVRLMIRLYCSGNHGTDGRTLCKECAELADYAAARTDHCPYMAAKTFCFSCKTHCYKPAMRENIRRVMRWSGPRMIFYHPVMEVRHLIAKKRTASSDKIEE